MKVHQSLLFYCEFFILIRFFPSSFPVFPVIETWREYDDEFFLFCSNILSDK